MPLVGLTLLWRLERGFGIVWRKLKSSQEKKLTGFETRRISRPRRRNEPLGSLSGLGKSSRSHNLISQVKRMASLFLIVG